MSNDSTDLTASKNLSYICAALREINCDLVIARYDGSGDSGQIENIRYYRSTKESPSDITADAVLHIEAAEYWDDSGNHALMDGDVEIFRIVTDDLDIDKKIRCIPSSYWGKAAPEETVTLEGAIESFVYANIPTPGWENNSGGTGCCLINVHGYTVTFKHADRIEDVSTCETTITAVSDGDGL